MVPVATQEFSFSVPVLTTHFEDNAQEGSAQTVRLAPPPNDETTTTAHDDNDPSIIIEGVSFSLTILRHALFEHFELPVDLTFEMISIFHFSLSVFQMHQNLMFFLSVCPMSTKHVIALFIALGFTLLKVCTPQACQHNAADQTS